jgi:hypothetical protein
MVLSSVSFAVSLVVILGMCMIGFLFSRKPKSKSAAHGMEEYDNFTTKNEFTMIN